MSLVSNQKTDKNTCELIIKVDGELYSKALESSYHKNSAKLNVPGFRKGKAPRKMIEQMYGEGVFIEDAVNALYQQAYADAVTEAKLDPVDSPEIEITSADKEGFEFKAKVTVKPEVEISDYKGIKAVKKVHTVTDEEISSEIDRLRERNSRVAEVDGRAAKLSDIANINFEGFIDDVAFEGGKGENFDLTLGSGQFIPGFEDQIVGKNVGESFDVNVSFPEDYQASELAAKPAVFKVTLNSLKEKQLPELDDEFVKDVSEFNTLDEYKSDIKEKLQNSHSTRAENEMDSSLMEQLAAKLVAEIPEVMFEKRVDEMIREFEYRLQSQGINLDMYLQYTGMEMENFRKNYREQAELQVKIRLALEKIAVLEGFEVSDEELDAEYAKIAESYKTELENVKNFIPAEDLKMDIKANKAVDLIKSAAKITEEND